MIRYWENKKINIDLFIFDNSHLLGKQQQKSTATLSQQSNNIILYQYVGYRSKNIVGNKYFTNKDMLAGHPSTSLTPSSPLWPAKSLRWSGAVLRAAERCNSIRSAEQPRLLLSSQTHLGV